MDVLSKCHRNGYDVRIFLLLIINHIERGIVRKKPELLALVFFVRFLAQLGVDRIIVRSGYPVDPW